jgi:Fe-S-cluster-containing hydrogenase component 2
MPVGWGNTQDAGSYRLAERADQALFGYTQSPQSWKRFLHPPDLRLWQAQRSNGDFEITPEVYDEPPYAFIGVRACELAAIAVQDRVFLQAGYVDTNYQQRREGLFIVAVNCGEAGETCFCASLGTGPQVGEGADLSLTEVINERAHYFLVEAGSSRGLEIVEELPHRVAVEAEIQAAQQIVAETAAHMGRSIETTNLKEALYQSSESGYWEQVAQRCLTCGNCTMVCPTCFCTTVEDITDLSGVQAERRRKWDSCFTMDFSYIHGGYVRSSACARYRQWLTHKMASWIDQFGTMGCVGCGRCITWCPVGIDITVEASAIQESQLAQEGSET